MKLKNYNFWVVIIIFFCLKSNTSLFAQTEELITYRDSITGSTIVFPGALEIITRKQSSFERAVIKYHKSSIKLYFMVSQKKELFSWGRINDFDNGDKYGKFVSSEPLRKIEGYIRVYKNKDYYTQLALIRGDYYACYLVESCYSPDDFHLKTIVNDSSFNKADFKQKTSWDVKFGTILLISLILTLLSLILKKRRYDGWVWVVFIFGIPAVFCLYTWLICDYKFSLCIFPTLVLFVISLGIYGCDSWKEVRTYLAEIFNHANRSI